MRYFVVVVLFHLQTVCGEQVKPLLDPYRRINDGFGFSFNPPARVSTINDVIRAVRATTFYTLLETSQLTRVLESSGPYTVFVPTDEAFNQLPRAAQNQLKHPDLLKHVLLYHIVPGQMESREFGDEVKLPTLISNKTLVTRVYADKKATVNRASIVVPDATASNGIVHVISDVIFPIPIGDVMETLESCPSFSKFVQLIKKANLEDRLTDPEFPVTLFAPTNDVFQLAPELVRTALSEELNMTMEDDLRKILLFHVVAGTYYSISMRDGEVLNTAADLDVEIGVRNGRMKEVGISRVSQSDIGATNGVIHAIDRVLSPESVCFF